MLIRSKFEGYKAGIRVYPGKSSAPAAPDYAAAANQTAAGNLEMAKYATNANRINQVTPYGQLTYDYKPTYDSQGKETGGGWTQTQTLTPQAQATLDKQQALSDQYADVAGIGFENTRGILENPNIDTSKIAPMQGIDMSKVSEIRQLDPNMSGVRALNSDMSGVRNLNTEGLNQVSGLNLNGLPQAPINAGQTAQDALYSRMNPSLARDEDALRTRLANQGISLGSSAYNREMELQGQRANDMRLQAAAQGIGLDQAARNAAFGEQLNSGNFDLSRQNQAFGQRQAMTAADLAQNQQQFGQNQALTATDLARNQQAFGQNQAASAFDLTRNNQEFAQQQNLAALSGNQRNQALQEAYTAQSRPLDLINALRTGAQVTNPQFQSFAQQATTQGPNMLGAAQAQYNADLQSSNANNAGINGLIGGAAGIGLGLAGLPGAGGSILQGAKGLFA